MVWFGISDIDLSAELRSINAKLGVLVATFTEAVEGWKSYASDLKAQRDAAIAALTEAQSAAQQAADALAAFQADDSATDAQQLADQAQAFADQLQQALDQAQADGDPVEPDPIPEPEPTPEG